jgi:hypothetical protein
MALRGLGQSYRRAIDKRTQSNECNRGKYFLKIHNFLLGVDFVLPQKKMASDFFSEEARDSQLPRLTRNPEQVPDKF